MENVIKYNEELDGMRSKKDCKRIASEIVARVQDGQIGATDAAAFAKLLIQTGENLLADVKDAALSELSKIGGKDTVYSNLVEESSTVKYDFSECGHAELNAIESKIKELQAREKEIKSFLKSIKGSFIHTDPETGETMELKAPKKTESTTLKITLK